MTTKTYPAQWKTKLTNKFYFKLISYLSMGSRCGDFGDASKRIHSILPLPSQCPCTKITRLLMLWYVFASWAKGCWLVAVRKRHEKRKQPVIQSPPRRGHQACLLAGFPIALNHCHLCLQLQEQMPRKNPSAKAEARESRYRNLEHCRNWYRRGENSVAQVTQPTKCSQETWLRIRETWLECRFFEGASQGTQCHQTVRVCNCFAIK